MNGTSSGLVNGTLGTQISLEQSELSKIVSEIESNAMRKMPNCAYASTPAEKFTKYSLDYSNPNARGKAEAYEKGLGYTKHNASTLISQIHKYVTNGNAPYDVSQTIYGTKYKYRISVVGPNGKTKNVIAVYQIDAGQVIPRLITNYLEGK